MIRVLSQLPMTEAFGFGEIPSLSESTEAERLESYKLLQGVSFCC
jgi:hypothetical protein